MRNIRPHELEEELKHMSFSKRTISKKDERPITSEDLTRTGQRAFEAGIDEGIRLSIEEIKIGCPSCKRSLERLRKMREK